MAQASLTVLFRYGLIEIAMAKNAMEYDGLFNKYSSRVQITKSGQEWIENKVPTLTYESLSEQWEKSDEQSTIRESLEQKHISDLNDFWCSTVDNPISCVYVNQKNDLKSARFVLKNPSNNVIASLEYCTGSYSESERGWTVRLVVSDYTRSNRKARLDVNQDIIELGRGLMELGQLAKDLQDEMDSE